MSALLTPDKIRILFFPTRQRLNFTGLGAGSRAQLALALELETKVFTVPEGGPFWGLLLVESMGAVCDWLIPQYTVEQRLY